MEKIISNPPKAWNAALVRTWLDRRAAAARLDQAAADRRGYAAQDDYDMAAAEEWVCNALKGEWAEEQAVFATRLKQLIGADDYRATGIYDDVRFERHVRGHLRRIARMTRANDGFEKTLRYR